MEEKINEIRKELRTRVKFAVIDILELVEKESGTSIRYEELPLKAPRQIRISIFSDLIRMTVLREILRTIKQHGLKIMSVIIERWKDELVLEIVVALKDGEKHDE